jgi:hypothetical protein
MQFHSCPTIWWYIDVEISRVPVSFFGSSLVGASCGKANKSRVAIATPTTLSHRAAAATTTATHLWFPGLANWRLHDHYTRSISYVLTDERTWTWLTSSPPLCIDDLACVQVVNVTMILLSCGSLPCMRWTTMKHDGEMNDRDSLL